jgi:peptidoglycan/xylan/chitin deacetylase (PgdA/CDA1 family)
LAGGGVLACVAAIALVGWLHFAGGGARAGTPAGTRPAAGGQRAAWRQWLSFPSYRRVVPVVMYHSIGGRPSYITTSRAQFADQMRALKLGGFHTLTLGQYAAFVRGDLRGLPERPILLTFDDGRQDAYLAATPVLRKYGFHATELAVPGWVTGHPGFSVSWAELAQMYHGSTWDVASHFGYGPEKIQVSKTGATGARFAYLQYLPAVPGRPGHPGHPGRMETFTEFRKQLAGNELWGIQQFRRHLPGFRPLATAIPGSNYGQKGTNDALIPRYVLSWLDHHFTVVFGGDYLNQGKGRRLQIPGRFSPRLSYRMSMGPKDSLQAFHCRLLDFVHRAPIAAERRCLLPPRRPAR